MLATQLAVGSASARSLVRLRLVALTIADLAGHEGPLEENHVNAALALRAGRGGLIGTR
jgi:predicted ATPase with chaperone activity